MNRRRQVRRVDSGKLQDSVRRAARSLSGDHQDESIAATKSEYGENNINQVVDTFQVEEFRPVSFSVKIDGAKDSVAGHHPNSALREAISSAHRCRKPESAAQPTEPDAHIFRKL